MACLFVGQSGGPTSVINSSLAGLLISALNSNCVDAVYGLRHGLAGLINEDFVSFTKKDISEIENFKYIPGAILGSVRYKLNDNYLENETLYKKILEVLIKYDCKYFFYIGGNDSMDTCNKINNYILYKGYDCKVIGIPKTIDNDLVLTDHTPGYGSAAKYIANSIQEIAIDTKAYKNGKVTIVEIMGRDAGWLTASCKLASINNLGCDLIYLPEYPFDMDKFLNDVKDVYAKKKRALIAISEGIKDKDGSYILNSRQYNSSDAFGHLQLGGVSLILAEQVTTRLGLPTRAIELNLPQRCASHLSSKCDVEEAYNCGKCAFEYALNNNSGFMVAINRVDNITNYSLVKLADVAAKTKTFPIEWIVNGNDISSKYIDYALPLIKGQLDTPFENGLANLNNKFLTKDEK